MQIEFNTVVVFEYVLRDGQRELIEASPADDPPSYVHGHGQLIPALEVQMEGHRAGERFEVSVPAGDAYGERDESLMVTVPRNDIPDGVPLAVGQSFDAVSSDGKALKLRVRHVDDGEVLMDGNHPLAGLDLHYDITIKSVRPASEEDILDMAARKFESSLDDDSSGSNA